MTTRESPLPEPWRGRRRFILLSAIAAGAALAGCAGRQQIGDSAADRNAGLAHLPRIRTANGLPPLAPDARLERAALEQSRYMAQAGRMAHSTGIGRDFATRMRRNGVGGTAAENLAHGGFGTERLFAMWMASTGHRNNMLNPAFTRFGLAYAREADGARRYWTLVLGS